MSYRYETHLHTFPVSKCAKCSVRDAVEFYKSLGYDGVFITNHFLDGNINCDKALSYEDQINFYFSDYEEASKIGEEVGIKVFLGLEITYKGTDFLIYGLKKEWYLAHPEIMEMKKSEELPYLHEAGALVIHAHPYREAGYIDHIRLFPRCVEGVEVINAGRTELENRMAKNYAEAYGLLETAGSDNHLGSKQKKFAGISCEKPLKDESDFINAVRTGKTKIFSFEMPTEI